MEPVVIARGGRPDVDCVGHRRVRFPRRPGKLGGFRVLVVAIITAGSVQAQVESLEGFGPFSRKVAAHDTGRIPKLDGGGLGLGALPQIASRKASPPSKLPASPTGAAVAGAAQADVKRYQIRDEANRCVVARLYGRSGDTIALLQPDGQIGFPTTLVPTGEPFVPFTREKLAERLQRSPYSAYKLLTTDHYLIFYQSKEAFARDSGRLLEELYRGLIDVCRRHGIAVHESEFPLVAVIFATEQDFRKHKRVDAEVQAYYEIFTNRIFLYEQPEHDQSAPRVMALRKPQTVAHEGAHQILGNIGVQPRLSAWPLWLVEGFAEYCATPTPTKKGVAWDRLGTINALHMATLQELDDPLMNEIPVDGPQAGPAARPPRLIESESLVAKSNLTPTDYAQAWALTHYLAKKQYPDFVRFLKAMSQMPPLEPRTPEQHLEDFRKFFGGGPSKIDRRADEYIRKLIHHGHFVPLPYYAVIFEQPLGDGMIRRAAKVSQSPQVIQRWLEMTAMPQGGEPVWQFFVFPNQARARIAVEEWMRGF